MISLGPFTSYWQNVRNFEKVEAYLNDYFSASHVDWPFIIKKYHDHK